jgi:acetylornithine deacetylase/succinyl-diaminopimelate desuccinylase-like protein
VKKLTPKGIETKIKVWSKGPASVVGTDNPLHQGRDRGAARYIQERNGVHPQRRIDSHRQRLYQGLKIPSVMMGFGLPDDNLHAPNEKFHIPNFHHGIETICLFFEKLGGK